MSNIGFRVRLNAPRPSQAVITAFQGAQTGHVCDAMNRFGAMDYRIKPLDPPMRMAGPALTVRIRPCDNLVIYKALDIAQPGDILVIATYDYTANSTWGDQTSLVAQMKGLAGMVTDGVVRDREGILEVGFPVFARGVMPSSPFKHGPGEINFLVSCGGQPVQPGDIIVGDGDGVVVVPQADAAQVAEQLQVIREKEEKRFADIRAGKFIPQWVEEKLVEGGYEIIE